MSTEGRETPLARRLKERIRREGPIALREYMQACLQDAEHGYYCTARAIGARGDFITAPEISQIFGELIGLWSAVVWQQMGRPDGLYLFELGPGRGTLMRDALRAMRNVSGLRAALDVHLVECNGTLREMQQATLAAEGVSATWHDDVASALMDRSEVARGPTILIANEFLDAIPLDQWVFKACGWHKILVGLDPAGNFTFQTKDRDPRPLEASEIEGEPGEGTIIEYRHSLFYLGHVMLGERARGGPLAALFLDYGHMRTTFGDTLQAVRGHATVSPFDAPGETDLTAHVDFEHFAACAHQPMRPGAGLVVDGPVTQAEFLGSLGAVERAARLMAANPDQALAIEAGVARLLAPNGMGTRFKALGVRSSNLPTLPGFLASEIV